MKTWFLLSLILLLNTGCSVYRSDGRKEFESYDFSKASFYLMECQKIASVSSFKDQLIDFGYEEEAALSFSIWSKDDVSYFQVVSLSNTNQSCYWAFASRNSFYENSASFIDMLSTSTSKECTSP